MDDKPNLIRRVTASSYTDRQMLLDFQDYVKNEISYYEQPKSLNLNVTLICKSASSPNIPPFQYKFPVKMFEKRSIGKSISNIF